ncbi:lipase family protein [Streptomyces cyaneofuscatus]|uniref:lipase family protein n=1 Tax=Streptomyces cyaneofuscatus TaxID=66883 RepID=UPI0033B0BC4A
MNPQHPQHHLSAGQPARRTRRPRATRAVLAATVLATAGLGAQATAAAAAPEASVARPAAEASFYTPPTDLPTADGELIRTQSMRLGLSLPGLNGPLPGTATRLMYKSTDSRGARVAVTGAYIEPAARWKGNGPRPLVALAPGTMGQGDRCAASKALESPLSIGDGAVSVGYENLAIYRFLQRGIAVVVTDYVGLGTPDRVHTYVNRVDGGHALLDAVRAARALPGTSLTPGSPTGLYGYSQGGGAAGSAAELQPRYAPDITLAGAYVGAPPADLVKVLAGVDGSSLAAALGWSINGFVEAVPELKPLVDFYTNDKGKQALAAAADGCVGNGIFQFAGTKSSTWTKTGQSLPQVVAAEPALQHVLDAQRIGRLVPAAPVRVATGVHDGLVPHEQARQLAADWCARGADVTYAPITGINLGEKLINHFTPLISDQTNAIAWVTDRLTGKPASPNCTTPPPDRD